MPQPTPEVKQAQANFKAAQQQLQLATFAQWEAGGVPLGWRIWAAFMGAGIGLMVSMPLLLLWSDYLFQQQWAARVQQNPRLANLPDYHHSWTGSLVFLLIPVFWGLALYKNIQLIKGFPKSCRTLGSFLGFGILLGLLGAYLLSRPLFEHF